MYPKIPPKKAQEEQERKKFLAQSQRDELKKIMSSKLQSKYSDKDPNLIANKVDNLLSKEKNITVKNLSNLEKDIKNSLPNQHQIENLQSPKPKGSINDDEISIKSGYSKMSGASNFDVVDKLSTKRFKDQSRNKEQEAKEKELLVLNEKPPANDLGHLREENEWAAIMNYNNFLFKKEEKLKQMKAKEAQIKFKRDLDSQLREKVQMKHLEKNKDDAYFENVKIQMKIAEEKEREKVEEYKKKITYEKETRDRQMKEVNAKRKYEAKQEKALDTFLIRRLKEELQMEKEFTQMKKDTQFTIMKKILEKEEDKKRRGLEDQEKERLDNIKLQEAYYNLIEEQEKNKDETLRKRDAKAKEFLQQPIDVTTKVYMDKIEQMEERSRKYQDRLERQTQEEELLVKVKAKEQKELMKNTLMNQVKEKHDRNQEEKNKFNSEQINMWKTDTDKFFDFEKNKRVQKKKALISYNDSLKNQMREKEDRKKIEARKMNENEEMINRKILDDIENMSAFDMTEKDMDV